MPGDRRSLCKARMKPIGLAFKNIKTNKYTGRTSGELMIIHKCLGCGQISCNRIAGDDNSHSIVYLLENSATLSKPIIDELTKKTIRPLTLEDKPKVMTALYGYQFCDGQ